MRPVNRHDVEDACKNMQVLLEKAHRGHTQVVTRHGKPYAAIVPVEQVTGKMPGLPLTALRGSGKGMWGKSSTRWLKRSRKE